MPFVSKAQLVSLIIRGDTLFGLDPSTGVYTQYTKLVPSPIGQEGKGISTNGTAYLWTDFQPLSAKLTSISALVNSAGYLYNNGSGVFSYQNPAGSGTVTDVSVSSANGFTGSVLNSTSTPAISIGTSVTGLLKGNGVSVAAATPGIDFTTSSSTETFTNKSISGSTNPFSNIPISAITNYTGYSINVMALTSSPTDAQTVYFGMLPKAPINTAGVSKIYIRKAGTLKIAEIYNYSGTAGTGEAWSLYVRVNNTTDYLIATVASATNQRIFSNTGLNISLSVGDYVEIKSINPTWATNPLTCIFGGYLYIE